MKYIILILFSPMISFFAIAQAPTVDLELSIIESADPVMINGTPENFEHKFVLKNDGANEATNISLIFTFSTPPGIDTFSVSSGLVGVVTLQLDGTPSSWDLPSLESGDSDTMSITFIANVETMDGSVFMSNITVNSVDQIDTNPSNDSYSETTTILNITPIPTLSQWGLIILAIAMLILGIVVPHRKKKKTEYNKML